MKNIPAREWIHALESDGFQLRKGKGSHEVWSKDEFVTVIATHNKEVPRYILQQLVGYLREHDLLGDNHEKNSV